MDELVCMEHSYIVVEDGRVAGVFRTLPERYAQLPVLDYGEQLILPGMTDLHVHAPQFAFRGLGDGYGAAGMAEYLYLPGGIQI